MLEGHLYNAAHMLAGQSLPRINDMLTREALDALVDRVDTDVSDHDAYVAPGTQIVLRDGGTQALADEGLELNTTEPVLDGLTMEVKGVYTDCENDDLRFYVELDVMALVGTQRLCLFLKRDDFRLVDADVPAETDTGADEDAADDGCKDGVCSLESGTNIAESGTEAAEREPNKVDAILAEAD